MEEIQPSSFGSGIGTGDDFTSVEPVKAKPLPPLVPPKPSKSRLSLGLASIPELDPSFVTDDRLIGCNSDFSNPMELNGSGNQNQEAVPDETGDWSQMLMLSPPEPEPFSNQSNHEPEEPIINFDQSANGCPFYKLHHQAPCEFLSLPSLPQIADEDKNILLAIDDLSSNVDHKIKFIVGNLENCGGIWPMMFVEKLNRLIVSADFASVKACFQDEELFLVDKLVVLYRNTRRCGIVFRYWCTFYNILARNLVPFPSLAESGILELLQRDFIAAANGQCKCTEYAIHDDEHNSMSLKVRMEIVSILLIPLFTAQTDSKPNSKFDPVSEMQFVSTVLKVISDKPVPAEVNVSEERDLDQLKDILVHLLLAYNLQYPMKKQENPLVEAILEDCMDGSILRAKLMKIFVQEYELLIKGCLDGIGSLIPQAPLGFQTVGVNGPLKLLISILSIDEDQSNLFDVDDLRFMLDITSGVQTGLSEDGFWDDKTEEIYSNCRMLQERLEFKLAYYQTEIDLTTPGTSGLDGSRSSVDSQANLTDISGAEETLGGKHGLIQCNRKPKNDRLLKSKDIRLNTFSTLTMWPVDVLMKCFGCSKRKATVAPATLEDLEDLDYF